MVDGYYYFSVVLPGNTYTVRGRDRDALKAEVKSLKLDRDLADTKKQRKEIHEELWAYISVLKWGEPIQGKVKFPEAEPFWF